MKSKTKLSVIILLISMMTLNSKCYTSTKLGDSRDLENVWEVVLDEQDRTTKLYSLGINNQNNIVVAGSSEHDSNSQDEYVEIMELNSDGEIVNQTVISDMIDVQSIKICENDEIVLLGYKQGYKIVTKRLSADFEILWSYEPQTNPSGYCIAGDIAIDNEGNILSLITTSANSQYNWMVYTLDDQGTQIAENIFDPSGVNGFQIANGIDTDENGNIVVCGAVGQGSSDLFTVMKFDPDFTLDWIIKLQNSGSAESVQFKLNGNIVSTGTSSGLNYTIELSSFGEVLNSKIISGEYVFGMCLEGYNIITCGGKGDYYQSNAMINCFDHNLDIEWSHEWSTFYDMLLFDIMVDHNGDFICVGIKKDAVSDYSQDAFITKISKNETNIPAPINFAYTENESEVILNWENYESTNLCSYKIYLNNNLILETENNNTSIDKSLFVEGLNEIGVSNNIYSMESEMAIISYTDIEEVNSLSCKLIKIYPNPFNPSTNISFNIVEEGMVNISIFNSAGQKVSELLQGFVKRGEHKISFNVENIENVVSGIYFCQLRLDNKLIDTKKLTFIK
ncbi:MAG: T9SS type A sorting domain-containing protein [Candidatus Delongbacteria bacterium]|nr:T9SS type A sorting domain-containing protein [Candidatus Delongbacteria bacterium]MBN2836144.1 T9SS type A sorting domain-containing protein [Candidatus Delongbacteria bacterium]